MDIKIPECPPSALLPVETMRDKFAMVALPITLQNQINDPRLFSNEVAPRAAKLAYEVADAMMDHAVA